MALTVLYRRTSENPDEDDAEIQAAETAGFTVTNYRTRIQFGDLVIGRYSVLPFYLELERDVQNRGAKLVNTYHQHQFIADMREWVDVLGDITPKMYPRLQDIPEKGPFVLKGQTNSKKHLWNTHMFAADKRAAGEVWSRLRDDMLLASQEIYVRDYVPLRRLGMGFNGLPITNEFRYFVCRGQVLCGAFYWASHVDQLEFMPNIDQVPKEFLQLAIDRIGDRAEFYALDVAQKDDGGWIVVEINDGQMSGLSCNSDTTLYNELYKVLR